MRNQKRTSKCVKNANLCSATVQSICRLREPQEFTRSVFSKLRNKTPETLLQDKVVFLRRVLADRYREPRSSKAGELLWRQGRRLR